MSKIGKELNSPADPRELSEINAEYNKVCAVVGDLYFKLKALEFDLSQGVEKQGKLHLEAKASTEAEAKRKEREEKAAKEAGE
jgi:hypothetical protein